MPESLSKSYSLKISSEESNFSGEYIFGAIFNSRSVGGFTGFPGGTIEERLAVDLQDGEFEVLLIHKPKNIADYGEILSTIVGGDIPENNPLVQFFKVKSLEIQAEEDLEWTLDGEFGGAYREMHVEILERAIKVMLPKKG